MKVYGYDGATGEYTGATDAARDPLAGDRYVMPHNSTRRTPPMPGPKQAAVFDGQEWGLVPDHRGETWWNAAGTPVIVSTLGDPADGGLSAEAPPTPLPSLADYAAAAQAMLDTRARERGYDSILSGVSYLDDPHPAFAAEAAALKAWRSAIWAYATAALAEVEAGARPAPGLDDWRTELAGACPFTWPEAAP
ncbi:hypothetical protein [Ancylobacter vacuolatus]|uniref:Phage tail assembly chaperone protein n=1 Tax=Ancylobacter vacuolatus TaxID=223389 RepID=A0ABU0DMQ4_9HYPH|nr:hypothetical protein [Ancylobacter vacuolatus]MDQ0349729.1 hypothetical protein [Ancylobacter vacuolatus]